MLGVRSDIMRILIGSAVGLIAGLLCLVQFLGWVQLFPSGAFTAVHAPALILADLVDRSERGWAIIPFTMVAQWILVGAIIGTGFHLRYVSKRTT